MIDTTSQFYALLTKRGEDKEAEAVAAHQKWGFSQMGVGDANGTDPVPDRLQTVLINEQYRADLNRVDRNPDRPNVIVAELIIPPEVGGWHVRELGLYDDDGELVAVANCAPSYKPLLEQGTGKTQVVRMNFIVTSAANVELFVDPTTVLVTRQSMEQAIQVFAEQLRELIAEPEGVAEGTFRKVTVDRRGLVVDGQNPTTLTEYEIEPATQQQAEAGEDNSAPMTALRVFQAIGKLVRQATESVLGSAKIATQELVNEGVDDETIVTPKKLAVELEPKAPKHSPRFSGRIDLLGETLSMQSTDPTNQGNLHHWFYNHDGSERALLYVDPSGTIRIRSNAGNVTLTLQSDGQVNVAGRLTVGDIVSSGHVYSAGGAAELQGDGNIHGAVYGGHLTTYLAHNYVQRGNLSNDLANYASDVGAPGTSAFMWNSTNVHLNPGDLAGGSSLTYTDSSVSSGIPAAGTWRCMGSAGRNGRTSFRRLA